MRFVLPASNGLAFPYMSRTISLFLTASTIFGHLQVTYILRYTSDPTGGCRFSMNGSIVCVERDIGIYLTRRGWNLGVRMQTTSELSHSWIILLVFSNRLGVMSVLIASDHGGNHGYICLRCAMVLPLCELALRANMLVSIWLPFSLESSPF